jgi:hypothetical protein
LGSAGAGGLLQEVRTFMSGQDLANLETSLTGIGGMFFNLFGVMIDLAFGLIGGLIGGAIFGVRRVTT